MQKMKRMTSINLTAALLLASGLLAQAQFAPQAQYSPSSVSSLVDRVHYDLNRAYGDGFRFTHGDRDRLNDAEKKLRDFSSKWDRGSFNKGELDDAIGRLQHVLDNNHLPRAGRDALSSDVSQLRRMRDAYDRHEIRGANY
jgi:hypothetical protein